ncbi:MAG: type I secretion system permease/ATPase [Pseudomonadota bacterium]
MLRKPTPIRKAWASLRAGFIAVTLFSLALNLFMLAGPLYMLQVYDRVLTSQNSDTLIALTVLLLGVFVVTGMLDLFRMRILARLGARFELRVGVPVLKAALRRKITGQADTSDNLVEDINGFRDFVSGSTLVAFFDAPWIPIYLIVLYALHPYLGLLGLAGAFTLLVLALINNARNHRPMQAVGFTKARSDALFRTSETNAELVQAMGMGGDLASRWGYLQNVANLAKTRLADRNATFSITSKTIRMGLQSGILGLGAALAIIGESTAGAMIAATIVLSRALAPIDQVIGQWRTFLAARGSYKKIDELTHEHPEPRERIKLPKARQALNVQIRQAGPPQALNATLSGVSFTLAAGDTVAVIGPSGSGKSTLAKMLAGVWTPQRGDVELDGAAMQKWDAQDLGQNIGYLPQDVVLFDGTIRENIARFASEIDDTMVLQAALTAGVHEMISGLEDGYNTEIGNGFFLSGGQRQRIALARALYGDPFLLVLDEPNSDLDTDGEMALRNAILAASQRGAIIVVMTHRPSTLQAVSKVLMLKAGHQIAFGDKEQVLQETRRDVLNRAAVKSKTAVSANNVIERAVS